MSVKMGQMFKSFIILLGQNIFNTDIVQYTHYLCMLNVSKSMWEVFEINRMKPCVDKGESELLIVIM